MATKRTSKAPKGTTRTEKATPDDSARPAKAARPRLHVSHGTKAGAATTGSKPPRARATTRTTKAAPLAPRAPKAPSLVPPRPRRSIKPAAPPSSDAGQLALSIAAAGLEKKASNVEIIDLGGKADYADYLVVMTGSSDRHVKALADGIQEALAQKKVRALSVEGMTSGNWVLIDFGAVVAHVFQESVRGLYDIEGLWLDASRVPLPE